MPHVVGGLQRGELRRVRLTLVIHSLGAGGAQRVATTLANAWVERGDKVTILTFTDHECPFYTLDPRVVFRQLGGSRRSVGAFQRLSNNARRVLRLRSELRRSRPSCIVSFIDQVNVITSLAALGLGTRVVIAERVDPIMAPISLIWRQLRDWTYKLADRIVMQTASAAASLPAGVRSRVVVIPNPVRMVPVDPAGRDRSARKLVLGIGRLVPQKGFDLLVEAFGKLAAEFSGWDLVILGEGPCRPTLEAAVRRLRLEERILLPGVVSDVAAYLTRTDLFVLASRFEGFPNVLCEAMSFGVACIATDCRSGPREIVRPGVDGQLVPVDSLPALTDAMRQLMVDEQLRVRLACRAREVSERFGLDRVLASWDIAIRDSRVAPQGGARC
jgi:GalNAc-alpha-(1->4)-GalNAc-alpha-(1->3)-diNAcBac-PP-undecaprenol alpha-1,4-N-acetyl-D-galactosaminyltransferase